MIISRERGPRKPSEVCDRTCVPSIAPQTTFPPGQLLIADYLPYLLRFGRNLLRLDRLEKSMLVRQEDHILTAYSAWSNPL